MYLHWKPSPQIKHCKDSNRYNYIVTKLLHKKRLLWVEVLHLLLMNRLSSGFNDLLKVLANGYCKDMTEILLIHWWTCKKPLRSLSCDANMDKTCSDDSAELMNSILLFICENMLLHIQCYSIHLRDVTLWLACIVVNVLI